MREKYHILMAEDEEALGLIVKDSLQARGFNITWCQDGLAVQQSFEEVRPDLIILDVMMPKKDGFSVAKSIRKHDKETPIIFLTAKNQTKDVVQGFEFGGNDYLKKPFSIEELIVRMNALLERKQNRKLKQEFTIGGYRFDYVKQELKFQNHITILTHREAELLYYLTQNKNNIVERLFILKKIWGDDHFFNGRSMDVYITKLRKKLKKDSGIQIINIRSIGYKLIC